ncbi:hypothetical protein MSPP1_003767 [Malassezia sp. CBS 17886]|nr:hypothetical protein MSPP1_003767 [Malassezia sp. CBS 17886]
MTADTAKYTHGYHPTVLAGHQLRNVENSAKYLEPHLKRDMRLLDVGSGAGTITCDFTNFVGSVAALEVSEEAIGITRAEAEKHGVPLEYAVGSALAIPFPDASFDVVHAHQVLQHVGDPIQALREMNRVLKPGGLVAARETDFPSFTWYPEDKALDEWRDMYLKIARSNGGDPAAGRKLLAWALAAGLTNITPGAQMWCYATPETRESWGGLWTPRILQPPFAEQAYAQGYSHSDMETFADALTRWKNDPAGWFLAPSAYILAQKE